MFHDYVDYDCWALSNKLEVPGHWNLFNGKLLTCEMSIFIYLIFENFRLQDFSDLELLSLRNFRCFGSLCLWLLWESRISLQLVWHSVYLKLPRKTCHRIWERQKNWMKRMMRTKIKLKCKKLKVIYLFQNLTLYIKVQNFFFILL